MNVNDYIGTWINDETEDCFEIINVEGQTAIASDGKRYDIMSLDLSGVYSKVKNIIDAPEIANQLGSMGYNRTNEIEKLKSNEVLGNLSKIGNSKVTSKTDRQTVNESIGVEDSRESYVAKREEKSEYIKHQVYNPIRNYIESAISVSRMKTSQIDTLSITIDLKLDFDILNVIKSAMQLGASDIEIIQHILDFVNIDIDDVKRSIANSLTEPVDSEIINENREEQLTNILVDEINK